MKVLDLFSGIGGFSLGLERAGMETVAFCEMDNHCQKVLKKHWPDVPIFDDVKKLSVSDDLFFYDGECYFEEKIDLICGGFPCQDISVAGNKKGLSGERSGLWGEFKRLIKEIKPRYALIENVANLRNLGLQTILKDLWTLGYASEWHIISARCINSCHLRERIWVIAYPNSERLERSREELQLGEDCKKAPTNGRVNDTTNTDMPRLWKPFASEKEKSEWWTEATASFRDWWEIESPICRVDDGLPKGLDKYRRERIKQLGNSVLPQIPELIGREIMKYEKDIK